MRVAGIGFRRDASLAALEQALSLAEAQGGRADALATHADKAGADVLLALARARNLPVHGVAVRGVATPTQSARVAALHGTGSLAEAAALVAAGPTARLTVARVTAPDGMATAAIAETTGEGT
ncbi:MAG: cobalamin biosynthesis protein [Paracoccaceae bacterium]